MKRKNIFFCIVEFLLYSTFMTIDLFAGDYYHISNNIKFISIVLCFVYTLLLQFKRKTNSMCLSLSFLFLMISDYFLLIEDSYTLGVCTFLCVQLLYLIYYSSKDGAFQWRQMAKECIIVLLISTIILISSKYGSIMIDATLVVSMIYFILFSSNLIRFLLRYQEKKEKRLGIFTLGLLLYFLCDINVGIFNLGQYVTISNGFVASLYQFSTVAMWMFYLPGIVLITLSNIKFD